MQEQRDKAVVDMKSGKRKLPPIPPDASVITIETNDTSERREIAGFTLRHIKQTETQPAQANGHMRGSTETRDGWYMELPNPQGWPKNDRREGWTTITLGRSGADALPRFEFKGNAPPRLPTVIEEIHTTKYDNGTTWTEKTDLVELSRGPIDPKLFEMPQGYREALHTPNGGRDLMRPDTLMNRVRAWWQYYRLTWYMNHPR